jgi:APA family basic amino acid/polyamine antiporter
VTSPPRLPPASSGPVGSSGPVASRGPVESHGPVESGAARATEILPSDAVASSGLSRRLGLFDATMLVMGGIVGSGIFMNPYVVARAVHTPFLVLAAWAAGGLVAVAGAFIYAELAARRQATGGQYAYLREAYHPAVAFVYGWALLLVIQSGGMAAVAVTFARYFGELTGLALSDGLVATAVLGLLTVVNCLGVRAGASLQNGLMVIKIVAIGGLVLAGSFLASPRPTGVTPVETRGLELATAFGAALIPVLFAYGGWQTASFVAGELRRPERDLPRGLLIGVAGVVALYLAVNVVCVRALGVGGLAATRTPASDVMRLALGPAGARLIACGIAVSTLGFLSQSILTAPRVYFAMAQDGVFFGAVGRLDPRTRVPAAAIGLQGIRAIVIALSGRYEQILNYVVSVDFIFFGLTATCVFVFRRRLERPGAPAGFRVPGHPVTTLLFIAACWLVAANTVYSYPGNTLIGLALVAAGLPVYWLWSARSRRDARSH